MKKQIQYIAGIIILAIGMFFSSCDDFLNILPKGEKIPTTLTGGRDTFIAKGCCVVEVDRYVGDFCFCRIEDGIGDECYRRFQYGADPSGYGRSRD